MSCNCLGWITATVHNFYLRLFYFMKFLKTFLISLLFIATVTMTQSCKIFTENELAKNYITLTQHKTELGALEIKHETNIKIKEADIAQKKDEVISAKQAQLQEVANKLYGEAITFNSIPETKKKSPEFLRQVFIMHNRATEANSAVGLPPTTKAIKEEADRLKVELDETLTSLDDLQHKHDTVVAENIKLVDAASIKEAELTKAKDALVTLEKANAIELKTRAKKIIDLQDVINANEKTRSDNKAWEQEQKHNMMMVTGGLSLVAIIAAIYIPLFRKQCVLAGIALGFVTFAILYLQPIHILLSGSSLLLLIGLWVILDHRHKEKEEEFKQSVAQDTYRAIEEIKRKSPEVYEKTIKPVLEEWHTVYDKESGFVIPNGRAQEHIDEVLIKAGDK